MIPDDIYGWVHDKLYFFISWLTFIETKINKTLWHIL